MKHRTNLPILALILGFFSIVLLLSPFVMSLHLYIDDFPYFYDSPRLVTDFWPFFLTYIQKSGLFRPLALVWYWALYGTYSYSPSLAHFIPFMLHVTTGYLLVGILKKHGLSPLYALLSGLFFVLFPFSVEQYTWLSATPGTVVNALLIIELLVINSRLSDTVATLAVVCVSLLSVFVYESTFFLTLPLSLLLSQRTRNQKGPSNLFGIAPLVIGMPTILYICSKLVIRGTNPRPFLDSIPTFIAQASAMLQAVAALFTESPVIDNFWVAYQRDGFAAFSQAPIILMVFLFMSGAFSYYMYSNRKTRGNGSYWWFWALTFLCSIPPLLVNKEFYFGFRSLFLPVSMGFIVFLFFAQKFFGNILQTVLVITMSWFLVSCIAIDYSMYVHYGQQYEKDSSISQQISDAIDLYLPFTTKDSVTVILKSEIPFENHTEFYHADYLIGCYYYTWSATACLKSKTDKVYFVIVKHNDGRVAIPESTTLEGFLTMRPRIEVVLTKDGNIGLERFVK